MVSAASATSHVVDKLTPERHILFLIILLIFFKFSIDLHAWKWIAGENGWWKSGSVRNRVAHWLDSSSIAP
jgi:hypothetical protein